tara:strand:+ start:21501 stop:21695 length:195 start_codon:yes stop_codon:yes gene_type:complete
MKELHDKDDPLGPADYIVTKQGKPYANFTHTVAHGTPSLLRCAAIACEMKANSEINKELQDMVM